MKTNQCAGLRSYGREPWRGVEGNTPGLKFEPAFTKIEKREMMFQATVTKY